MATRGSCPWWLFLLFGVMDELNFAIGGFVLLRMDKGASEYSRPIEGWATTYGVIDANGKVIPTVDRENEVMLAAGKPGLLDASRYLSHGYLNDAHSERLLGIPHSWVFSGLDDTRAQEHGKVGCWTNGHIIDRAQPASWANLDGSPRFRMLKDGTVVDRPWDPTPEEKDRADYYYETGVKSQGEGRTLGFSIQGKKAVSPSSDGTKQITYGIVTQCAVLPYPHNYDATVEWMGKGLSESPETLALANALLMPGRNRRYRLNSQQEAITAARRLLMARGVRL